MGDTMVTGVVARRMESGATLQLARHEDAVWIRGVIGEGAAKLKTARTIQSSRRFEERLCSRFQTETFVSALLRPLDDPCKESIGDPAVSGGRRSPH